MKDNSTTYTCQGCRIHLHSESAAVMCEVEQGSYLCIRCQQPMMAQPLV